MKKLLCLILILVSVLSLGACSKEPELIEVEIVNGTTVAAVGTSEAQGKAPYLKKTMRFSIPLSFLSEKDLADLDTYCKDHGYTRIKINEKNSTAKIEMPKLSHQLLMTQLGMDAIKAMYDILEGEKYPFFKSIESFDKKNFREIVITVDGAGFSSDVSATDLIGELARSCYKYQAYSTSNYYRCKITVKDAESGAVLSNETYAL